MLVAKGKNSVANVIVLVASLSPGLHSGTVPLKSKLPLSVETRVSSLLKTSVSCIRTGILSCVRWFKSCKCPYKRKLSKD